MLKIYKILIIFLITTGFTSCIELVEEININSDLSGKYHFYLKHNGFGFLFRTIPKNLKIEELDNGLKLLSKQKGISNLSSNVNLNKGILSIKFNFDDAKSLNRAFYASLGAKKQFYHKSFLKINKSAIKRPDLSKYIIKYVNSRDLLDRLPDNDMLNYFKYKFKVISSRKLKARSRPNTITKPYEYSRLYPLRSILLDGQSTKNTIKFAK